MNTQGQGTGTQSKADGRMEDMGSQGQGTGMQSKPDGGMGNIGTHGHEEGTVAKTIEQQTAKMPSDWFLWAAIGGMGVSAVLELAGFKSKSRFFGQWVAPFLLFGVYNKLVKQHGSDKTETVH